MTGKLSSDHGGTLVFMLLITCASHDMTNLGALVAGVVYGFFTCPVFQLGSGSEGFVTVGADKQNRVDPCKSFLIFTIFVAVLVTFVLVLGDGVLTFPTYDDVFYSHLVYHLHRQDISYISKLVCVCLCSGKLNSSTGKLAE